MKVLYFTNIPSPYRVDFFEELGKLCDLTVLYERSDATNRDRAWLKDASNSASYQSVFLKGIKVGVDTALCLDAIKYWNDASYDIRIVGDYTTPTGILSILYMKMKGIPYGIECDGGYLKSNENLIVTKLKTYLLSSAEFAFSPGKTTDAYLRQYGVHSENIFFYPFTSLTDADVKKGCSCLGKQEHYKKLLGVKEEKMIVAVGQMIHRKGFDVLLGAAQYIQGNVGIYIIGGSAPDEYIDFVREHNLGNVHFLDFKSKDELGQFYAAADLFVLPTRDDIWGLVVEEAMSFGLPVITTDKCVSGVELISEQGGIIVPINDIHMLADAINKLLNNEAMIRQLAKNNLEKIRLYTIENMARYHVSAFKQIEDMK